MQRPNQFTSLLCTVMLLALTAALPAFAHQNVLPPVDEASQDPEFFAFRARLIDLLMKKDVEGVVAIACPQFQVGLDGPIGLDVLRDYLTTNGDQWDYLLKTLSLGGRLNNGHFLAPYTATVDVPNGFDLYTTFVITGSDVLVRNKP